MGDPAFCGFRVVRFRVSAAQSMAACARAMAVDHGIPARR
jgi:hypothetical protein